jgi:hypothetical protein
VQNVVSVSLRRWIAVFVLGAGAMAAPAGAQNYIGRADALLRQGQIFQAEALYYYAARTEPRNATPRLALGRYLAARGALRVGAVLLEEARFFGGDRRAIAEHLAPVYARLGDYRALSSLPNSPLAYAERARADWLSENVTEPAGPDSVMLPLLRAAAAPLGQIRITIGSDTLIAMIDVTVTGLVLDTSWATRRGIRVFRSNSDVGVRDHAGVVPGLGLGALVRSGVPARFEAMSSSRTARIGVDVLEDFAPTWIQGSGAGTSGTLVLRKAGKAPTPSSMAERIPILIRPNDLMLVRPGGVVASLATQASQLSLTGRWTLDIRHGEVVIDR